MKKINFLILVNLVSTVFCTLSVRAMETQQSAMDAPESIQDFIESMLNIKTIIPWYLDQMKVSLIKIPLDKRKDLKVVAQSMMTPDMFGSDKAQIIYSIGKVIPEKWEDLKRFAESMITSDMKGGGRSKIIYALGRVIPEKWEDLKRFAESMVTSGMKREDYPDITCSFSYAEPEKWEVLKSTAESMMTPDMPSPHRVGVIRVLGINSPQKWEMIKDTVESLITPTMVGKERGEVIEAFSYIPEKNVTVTLKAALQSLIKPEMSASARSTVIRTLGYLPPEKVDNFARTAQLLITPDMDSDDFWKVIDALAKTSPEKWEELKNTAESMITPDMVGSLRAKVIRVLGNTSPENWEVIKSTVESVATPNIKGVDRGKVIEAFEKFSRKKVTTTFKAALQSLIRPDMNASCLSNVIEIFASFLNEEVDDVKVNNFRRIAQSLITRDMDGSKSCRVIRALSRFSPEKWEEFKTTVESMMTADMNGSLRKKVIVAFGYASSQYWETLKNTAESLITPSMKGEDRVKILKALKISLHFGNEWRCAEIRRLITMTQVHFSQGYYGVDVIQSISQFNTEEQARAFVTGVIGLVQTDRILVDENRLMTHMQTMKTTMRNIAPYALQELLLDRQNTHKREVHESVAASLERLKIRYPEALAHAGRIYEMISGVLSLLFGQVSVDLTQEVEKFFNTYKHFNIQDPIYALLQLNPYQRGGEGDTDTKLNIRMREFLEPYKKKEDAESKAFVKAVENLMGLYAKQNDLRNALSVLVFMEETPNYREGITHLSYADMLSLVYQGITDTKVKDTTDVSILDDAWVTGRWSIFMRRLAQAKHEYGLGQACTAGTFNAAVESLDRAHPNVTIIQSFRLLMQEIGLEKDDAEFERRVSETFSHIGPHAKEDPYYQKEVNVYRSLRAEQREDDQK